MKTLLLFISVCLLWAGSAWAETLTWTANSESDLAGYKVYRSTTSGTYGAPLATLGKVITYTITLPPLAVDTKYFMTVTAYDKSGNESPKSNEVSKLAPAAPVVTKPGTPVLTVISPSATSLSVTWLPVSNGAVGDASVNVRYAVSPISWGSASSATCTSSPCVITGLTAATKYDVQAVAYRPGTPNIFGPLSAIVSATTGAVVPPPVVKHCVAATTVSPSEITIKGVPCVN